MSNLSKRLNISLKEKKFDTITELAERENISKAELVRRSLDCYCILKKYRASLDCIESYLRSLKGGEHLVIDLEHWQAIFREIGEENTEFWKAIYKSGERHFEKFEDIGITKVENIVNELEKRNWFRVNNVGEKEYVLVATAEKTERFISEFLKGFFDASPHEFKLKQWEEKILLHIL